MSGIPATRPITGLFLRGLWQAQVLVRHQRQAELVRNTDGLGERYRQVAERNRRGRPGSGSSSRPSHRNWPNRLRHLRIVPRSTPRRAASSVLEPLRQRPSTTLARNAKPAALVRRRAHPSNSARSSSVNTIRAADGPRVAIHHPHLALRSQERQVGLSTRRGHFVRDDQVPSTAPDGPARVCWAPGERYGGVLRLSAHR
jgi:hypothetical protein